MYENVGLDVKFDGIYWKLVCCGALDILDLYFLMYLEESLFPCISRREFISLSFNKIVYFLLYDQESMCESKEFVIILQNTI